MHERIFVSATQALPFLKIQRESQNRKKETNKQKQTNKQTTLLTNKLTN